MPLIDDAVKEKLWKKFTAAKKLVTNYQ